MPPTTPTTLQSPCGRWTAWIETDKKLEVYSVSGEGKSAEGWVVAEPGASYTVHLKCVKPKKGQTIYKDTSFHSYIDGAKVNSQITAFARNPALEEKTLIVAGRRISSRSIQGLSFRLVERSADGGMEANDTRSSKLGTIELLVWRGITGAMTGRKERNEANVVISTLNEKTKKGMLDNVTKFGEERTLGTKHNEFTRPPKEDLDNPFFTFRFHYRGKDLLMAMDKIPNPNAAAQTAYNKRNVIEIHDSDSEPEPEAGPSKGGPHKRALNKEDEVLRQKRLKAEALKEQARRLWAEAETLGVDADDEKDVKMLLKLGKATAENPIDLDGEDDD